MIGAVEEYDLTPVSRKLTLGPCAISGAAEHEGNMHRIDTAYAQR
jgi:hypothetical protein